MLDDLVEHIKAEIVSIGLATGDSVGDEVSGNGYEPLAPAYGDVEDGAADLDETLAFDGPANVGPVTHLIYRTSEGVWAVRPVSTSASFNSDGRLDVTSAPITVTFS